MVCVAASSCTAEGQTCTAEAGCCAGFSCVDSAGDGSLVCVAASAPTTPAPTVGALANVSSCLGLLETEAWDLLSIPSCLIRLTTTTTLPPPNCTLNATAAPDTGRV